MDVRESQIMIVGYNKSSIYCFLSQTFIEEFSSPNDRIMAAWLCGVSMCQLLLKPFQRICKHAKPKSNDWRMIFELVRAS